MNDVVPTCVPSVVHEYVPPGANPAPVRFTEAPGGIADKLDVAITVGLFKTEMVATLEACFTPILTAILR